MTGYKGIVNDESDKRNTIKIPSAGHGYSRTSRDKLHVERDYLLNVYILRVDSKSDTFCSKLSLNSCRKETVFRKEITQLKGCLMQHVIPVDVLQVRELNTLPLRDARDSSTHRFDFE